MALESGSALGPYEVISSLGAGGMGEVYKAKDTRLDRTVAIKVLPDGLSQDPARRERFEREARAVSRLNHPHICTLHDVGHHDGIDFIVMEHIEGETLAQRLKKGAFPLKQALEYGIQIADALDKAHRQGVVHRDLKPGNVMLTKSGVKLLDFGLAKFQRDGGALSGGSEEETEHKPLTGEGAILGTLQYMAPEQLEGNEVDARTDIFTFGAVLYEMVTGRKAFEGKSQASLIGAILKDEPPPISRLRSMTPPGLDRIVRRCLAKDPEDRWQSARDLVLEMKSQPEDLAPERVSTGGRFILVAAGALIMAAALGGYFLRDQPSPSPVRHLAINVPSKDSNEIALSPDGSGLAYTATDDDGVTKIYLRKMDTPEASVMEGSEGAASPFFSPDGQWLGFVSGSEVKKAPVSGGLPTPIGEIPAPWRGATWGVDGAIWLGSSSGLWRLRNEGGEPELFAPIQAGEIGRSDPVVLPSHTAVVYAASFGLYRRVCVLSLESGDTRILFDGSFPRYSPTGHLLYVHEGTLWATRFDPRRLEVEGSPVAIESGVLPSQYALASDGTLVYAKGSAPELVWVSRSGETTPILMGEGGSHPRLSPDGRRLVVGADSDLWVLDLDRKTRERITLERDNAGPVWTPDGKRIAFNSNRGGQQELYWKNADGSGTAERLFSPQTLVTPLTWTPDGRVLGLERPDASGRLDIWLLDISGERTMQKYLAGPFNESGPKYSPNGKVLTFVSDESGRQEVYAQPYPGPGPRMRVSTEGGTAPVWSRDGMELFYVRGQQMFAVSVRTEPVLELGTPRVLFEGPYNFAADGGHPHYDVAPDGRFVVSTLATGLPTFDVILNFDRELERLLPPVD